LVAARKELAIFGSLLLVIRLDLFSFENRSPLSKGARIMRFQDFREFLDALGTAGQLLELDHVPVGEYQQF